MLTTGCFCLLGKGHSRCYLIRQLVPLMLFGCLALEILIHRSQSQKIYFFTSQKFTNSLSEGLASSLDPFEFIFKINIQS